MERSEEREQAHFIKWASPVQAHVGRQAGRARPADASAILLDPGLALEFKSARAPRIAQTRAVDDHTQGRGRLGGPHLRTAEEARAAVQFYLDVQLSPV